MAILLAGCLAVYIIVEQRIVGRWRRRNGESRSGEWIIMPKQQYRRDTAYRYIQKRARILALFCM